MFCPQCGTNIHYGKYCPVCGYFADRKTAEIDMNTPHNRQIVQTNWNRNKFLPILAVVVAGVVLTGVLLIRGMTNNSTHAIKKFYHAIEKQNAQEMLSCIPNDFVKDLMDDYDVEKDDINDALDEYLSDGWICDWVSDDYDPGSKIPLTIIAHNKMDQDELKDMQRDLTDVWAVSCKYFDSEKIKKGESCDIDFDDDDDYFLIVSTYQYKGKWYYYNALALVEHATRLYG